MTVSMCRGCLRYAVDTTQDNTYASSSRHWRLQCLKFGSKPPIAYGVCALRRVAQGTGRCLGGSNYDVEGRQRTVVQENWTICNFRDIGDVTWSRNPTNVDRRPRRFKGRKFPKSGIYYHSLETLVHTQIISPWPPCNTFNRHNVGLYPFLWHEFDLIHLFYPFKYPVQHNDWRYRSF